MRGRLLDGLAVAFEIDTTNEPVAVENRQHIIAVLALRSRDK